MTIWTFSKNFTFKYKIAVATFGNIWGTIYSDILSQWILIPNGPNFVSCY